MLQRIRIEGYRSCKRGVELDKMGPITALLGRNGSGKTNILRAISRLANLASCTDLTSLPLPSPFDGPESYLAEVLLEGNLYRYTATVQPVDGQPKAKAPWQDWTAQLSEMLVLMKGSEKPLVLLTREQQKLTVLDMDSIPIGPLAPALTAASVLLPESAKLHKHLRPLLDFFWRTSYFAFDEPNEISGHTFISEKEYEAWRTGQRTSASATPHILFWLIHAHLNDQSGFKELGELLGSSGLDLIKEINVFSFRPTEGQPHQPQTSLPLYYGVIFEPGGLLGGGEGLSFHQLSLGTRRVIRILACLILGKRSLILLEHPEEGIHPGLLKRLSGLLRDNADPVQIILSSHSPDVFNWLLSENIRMVTIHDRATSAHSLTSSQLQEAANYIREEGTLAEFLEMTQEV